MGTQSDPAPVIPGGRWRHANGNEYTVACLANEHTQHPEKYPVTVIYRGDNGRVWSRALSDWHRSMSPAPGAGCGLAPHLGGPDPEIHGLASEMAAILDRLVRAFRSNPTRPDVAPLSVPADGLLSRWRAIAARGQRQGTGEVLPGERVSAPGPAGRDPGSGGVGNVAGSDGGDRAAGAARRCSYCGKPEDSLYWDGGRAVVACRPCAEERMMFSYLGRAGDPVSQESVRRWGGEIAARASSAGSSPGG